MRRDLHPAELVSSYFERDGFEVASVGDGPAAIARAKEWGPSVMVLDLGLPAVDGIEVCRVVRTFSDCCIVVLTARVEEIDKVMSLSIGADGYVTKPFSPRELLARVQAMLRRPRRDHRDADEAIQIGSLSLDLTSREVRLGERLVDLTRIEFDGLATVAVRPRAVFTRRPTVLLAFIAVSIFLTRVSHPLEPVTTAAQRVATEDHDARGPHVGMSREFDELTVTFNDVATDLGQIGAICDGVRRHGHRSQRRSRGGPLPSSSR